MNPQYEGIPASPAVRMLCQLFIEKVQREQQDLALAASQTEPQRIQDGFVLNIENAMWVREIKPPEPEKQDTPSEE